MDDKQKAKLNKAIKAELYKHIYFHLDELNYVEEGKRDYSNYTDPLSKNKDKHITPLPKAVLTDLFDLFVGISNKDSDPNLLEACSLLAPFTRPNADSSYFHCVYIELSTKLGLDKPKDAADLMCTAFTRFIHRVSWLIACSISEQIKLTHPLFKAYTKSLGVVL